MGCLEPVRDRTQMTTFVELGGANDLSHAERQLERLIPLQLGDLFLAKGRDGAVLSWVRVTDQGGRGVMVESGSNDDSLKKEIRQFAERKHAGKRLFANAWQDERGDFHFDELRTNAKLRDFAGLEPLGMVFPRGRQIASGKRGSRTEGRDLSR